MAVAWFRRSSGWSCQGGLLSDLRDFPRNRNRNRNHTSTPCTNLLPTHASMKRSSTVLRQWLQLRRARSSTSFTTPSSRANVFLVPLPATLTLPTSRNDPSNKRGFHSTQPQHAQPRKARPAPATRLKDYRGQFDHDARLLPDQSGYASRQGVLLHSLQPYSNLTLDDYLNFHSVQSQYYYDRAVRDGYLPSAISFKTFRNVHTQLCTEAFTGKPSAQAIRAISVGR